MTNFNTLISGYNATPKGGHYFSHRETENQRAKHKARTDALAKNHRIRMRQQTGQAFAPQPKMPANSNQSSSVDSTVSILSSPLSSPTADSPTATFGGKLAHELPPPEILPGCACELNPAGERTGKIGTFQPAVHTDIHLQFQGLNAFLP